MMSPNYYEFSVFSNGKTPSIRAYHVSGTWYMTHVITRRGGSVRQRALNAVPLCTRLGVTNSIYCFWGLWGFHCFRPSLCAD